ncbi:MAG: PEP/pyruvate-binding domain-containing protein [Desulfocapsaceae bacterium]|nr:PEP/pyruvate-binding domain-containing protein [Desulfocapsaceae bacterium]
MLINTLFKYWTYRLFAPGVVLRGTYDAFRELLVFDSRSHELMADLEDLYYQGKKEDFCRIAARYDALSASVGGMVECLERMAPGSFVTLPEYFRKFDFYSRFLLAPPTLHFGPPFVLTLRDPAVKPELAGGKSATLAVLTKTLQLPVPSGFIITVNSFHYLLEYNDLRSDINELLAQIDLASPGSLARISQQLMELIKNAEVPPDIENEILATHTSIWANQTDDIRVAVRSSAVGEDGECSFAGQYTTLLEVQKGNLIPAYLTVLASKYTPESLAYRIHSGLSDEETPMAVLVLEMINAQASGVVYTVDPAGLDSAHLFIHAVPGQGEALVSGRKIPDVLAVARADTSCHKTDPNDIAKHFLTQMMTAEQITSLATDALKIEAYFQTPQDIEWTLTDSGKILFLQSRALQSHASSPETNIEKKPTSISEIQSSPLLRGGTMAALGQACGPAYRVDTNHPVEQVPAGAILVIRETLPSYVQVLDRVKGVLAELGSVVGHFSTVCREYGVPLICGLGPEIQTVVGQGKIITMHAEMKSVYEGDILPRLETLPLHESQKQLPFFRKLCKLLDTITPLHLIDPKAKGFSPESCRSLHDIIRFAHEQAVRSMFSLGDRLGNRSRKRKKLLSDLPFDIFVVDVGGGLLTAAVREETITVEQISSAPFQALWAGLTHPSVQWQERAHFDWKQFGELTMADGITSSESSDFASYAVLGTDYINLIMRFGYHFTLVDALCGEDSSNNYCQFRFAGGGADFSGRLLRLDFIRTLLQQAGFQIETRGDLLDARISSLPSPEMKMHLFTLGRLLGATRLMDMSLHDTQEVEQYVQNFLEET